MAYQRRKLRIGDLLVSEGLLTFEQLDTALDEQKRSGSKLGEVVVRLGFVTQDQINQLLCEQLDIEFVNLRKIDINDAAVKLVPEATARKYLLLPFNNEGNVLYVAMENPMDILAMDDIEIITNMTVQPFLANASDINTVIDKYYGHDKTKQIEEEFKREQKEYLGGEEDAARNDKVENSPIVALVRTIIEQAVRQRASDIHIEPYEDIIRIRYRIDGDLRVVNTLGK